MQHNNKYTKSSEKQFLENKKLNYISESSLYRLSLDLENPDIIYDESLIYNYKEELNCIDLLIKFCNNEGEQQKYGDLFKTPKKSTLENTDNKRTEYSDRNVNSDFEDQMNYSSNSSVESMSTLIEDKLSIKIADFGLARLLKTTNLQYTLNMVTLWYRPPELLMSSKNYDEKVDIWSVGCIFAELLIGSPIIKEHGEIMQLVKIQELFDSKDKNKIDISDIYISSTKSNLKNIIREHNSNIDDSAIELIDSMLTFDPKKRMNSIKLLQSSFFKKKFI